MKVPINQIKVRKRLRKDLGNLEPLINSLKKNGLINPILVTSDYCLIAGERRLTAAKKLGWNQIPVLIISEATSLTLLELEIEENLHRKNLSTEELKEGYQRLERLRRPSLINRIKTFLMNFFHSIFKKKD
ncbi:ParB N-terminal domain-containing protein [Spirochaeta cellobiosiphila]|uniref:ParB N-terminal domain-containing protein n=1 Tax=Spirochaeta cellobiosiphila TaxID=504483 RepID=UPI000409DFEE|nr:ParB N-terminal domain-containing protein [Spirochaeta cellobiosiphila]